MSDNDLRLILHHSVLYCYTWLDFNASHEMIYQIMTFLCIGTRIKFHELRTTNLLMN